MPIGAIIGGVASVAGSVIGSSSNKKAANKAAQASQQATDQTVGLQRDIYNQNRQTLNPFVQRGNAAGNAINALLGLGGAEMSGGGPATMNIDRGYQPSVDAGARYGLGEYGGMMFPSLEGQTGAFPSFGGPMSQMGGQPMAASSGATSAQQQQENAFERFRNSSGYKFRVNEGMDALNSGYAGSGLVQSGAALRGLDDYRQNMAASELGNYMAYLSQQQGTGLSGASALAGVGQSYANNAGQLIMNNADNQANAAIYRAQNNPFTNLLGTVGGGLLGYGR